MKLLEHPSALRLPVTATYLVIIWPLELPRFCLAMLMLVLFQWIDYRSAYTGLVPLSVWFLNKIVPVAPVEDKEEAEKEDSEPKDE